MYRGCANLLARAAGRPVLPGAEVPYVDLLQRDAIVGHAEAMSLLLRLLCAPVDCNGYNRKAEEELERQKTELARNLKSSPLIRMAQQHHHESLSQHLKQVPVH